MVVCHAEQIIEGILVLLPNARLNFASDACSARITCIKDGSVRPISVLFLCPAFEQLNHDNAQFHIHPCLKRLATKVVVLVQCAHRWKSECAQPAGLML